MRRYPHTKPRIIIHGAGYVASRLFAFCRQKNWPVVAVFNRAGPKTGQDIGQVFGLDERFGLQLRDFDSIDSNALRDLEADIALIAITDFYAINYPAYERYLTAGINVLCHGVQAYNPRYESPELAAKVDQIAKVNGVTFSGSGIWDTTRIWSGIIAAGTCLDIACVTHTATAEIGRQGAQYEAAIGVGLTVDQFNERYTDDKHPMSVFLHGPPVMVLQKIGCTIKSVHKRTEPIVFDIPVVSPYSKTTFPAGIVVGSRTLCDIETVEGIKGRTEAEYRLFKDNEIEEIRWHINGRPGLKITVVRDDTANLSASSLFNRIPDVLSAPPGIVELMKMGPLSSSALIR